MFATHQPQINRAMRTDAKAFWRGVMFAVLSARTQFPTVPDQLDHVRQHGIKSKHLFAWKRETFKWLKRNLEPWRERVLGADDTELALRHVMECPGLGLVKGAFVLQFIGHDIACMDSRNATREELARDHWGLHGARHGKAFERKLKEYIRYTTGRSEELWDTWCHEIASVYDIDAFEVSAIHAREICRAKAVTFGL